MPPALFGKIRSLFGARESGAARKIIERDARYVVHGSLIYRPAGGSDWHKGMTENLSTTGVLFRGEAPMEVSTPVELSITPPKGADRKSADSIFCWGTIVRTGLDNSTSTRPVFAVKIDRYRTPPKFLSDADIKYERMA